MANKQSICCAVILCLLSWSVNVQAQNKFKSSTPLQDVQLAVENSRDHWLHMFPDDDLKSFGFSNRAELTAAVPGNPIEVYLMYQEEGKQVMKPAGEFLIPMKTAGNTTAFLTVAYFEGRYRVVSAGEMNLAMDASKFIAGNNQVWVRNIDHNADFIGTKAADDAVVMFTPLFTAERASFNAPVSYNVLIERFNSMIVNHN